MQLARKMSIANEDQHQYFIPNSIKSLIQDINAKQW